MYKDTKLCILLKKNCESSRREYALRDALLLYKFNLHVT